MRVPSRKPFLRRYFDRNDGHLIDKWLHYFPVYEQHFAPFRGARPRVLEIGISHGGSLQMWRRYFGRGATVVGIDIEPRVTSLAEPGLDIHVGSQSDPEFLAELVDRYGGFDIVIDDGSHRFADQRASLDALWPSLSENGVRFTDHRSGSAMRPDVDGARRHASTMRCTTPGSSRYEPRGGSWSSKVSLPTRETPPVTGGAPE